MLLTIAVSRLLFNSAIFLQSAYHFGKNQARVLSHFIMFKKI